MPNFGISERTILSYFTPGTELCCDGRKCTVVEADKPTCQNGEPKTDIFVRLRTETECNDIKISYKQENADFLENKIDAQRAKQLFGRNWRHIIQESTGSIKNQFYHRDLIYKESYGKTRKGSITLGWKFELVNKEGGLSGLLKLSRQQLYDVYAGTNLSPDKKNAIINGRVIANSGVAEYILNVDCINSAQDAIDKMIPINQYIQVYPNIYFACKALNYRTFENRYDGDRPLAVQVQWSIRNGKLTRDLIFNTPLENNGTKMAERLMQCLRRLGIQTTDNINSSNTDMSSVNIFGQ